MSNISVRQAVEQLKKAEIISNEEVFRRWLREGKVAGACIESKRQGWRIPEETIAAISVAAHEIGHAIQDKDGYVFMKMRAILAPIVNFVTYIGYIMAFISIVASITGYLKISILIILAALLFQLITLPVEFDASKRAKEEILKLS